MDMMKKIFVYSLAVMALVACGSKTTTTEEDERVEQVRTTILQPREIEREISVSTNLQGYLTQNVAPSLTGKIEHIYREVGDRVSAGSDLVRMDQTQYKTTKISLGNLEIEKNRVEMLLKTGSATQQQYDQITTQYNSTKEQLEFLETNTYVKAPFAGVISAKNYEDGELYVQRIASTDVDCVGEIMGTDNNRGTSLAVIALNHFLQKVLTCWVKEVERLVEDENLRSGDEC